MDGCASFRSIAAGLSCLMVGMGLITLSEPTRAQTQWLDPDGRPLPFETDEQVLDFLSAAEFVWKEKMKAGTNKKKRKVLLERDGVRAHAIHRTGYEVKHIAGGGFVDSYESEIAAYNLSRLLGLDSVPPVVRRKGGSLQLWIEGATTEASRLKADAPPPDPESYERQMQNLRVFDNLIANTDRNPGNILLTDDGRVWFIDHTRSFAGQEELRNPDSITGCEVELWNRLRSLTEDEVSASIKAYVGPYLDALMIRRDLLVELIEERIREQGESEFLFASKSQ